MTLTTLGSWTLLGHLPVDKNRSTTGGQSGPPSNYDCNRGVVRTMPPGLLTLTKGNNNILTCIYVAVHRG